MLTAQLAVGKQLYGLLSVGSKEADYFDEHKIRLHQILAERGGLALHEGTQPAQQHTLNLTSRRICLRSGRKSHAHQ